MPLFNDLVSGSADNIENDPNGFGSITDTFVNNFGSSLGFGSGNLGYMGDATHAARLYGDGDANYFQRNLPRTKFQYFVMFNLTLSQEAIKFNNIYFNSQSARSYAELVKRVDMPSMDIETEVLNQYNKKRISQKKINFNPINVTMHDVVDGKTLRFWELYYEWYFKDGVYKDQERDGDILATGKMVGGNLPYLHKFKEFRNDILTDKFESSYGYNLDRIGNTRYLFDSIDIFQVHGGKYSKVRLMHPRISAFKQTQLDQEQNGLCEVNFTIEYEDAIYTNFADKLSDSWYDFFANYDYLENKNLSRGPKTPLEIAKRDLSKPDAIVPGVAGDKTVLGNFQKNLGGLLGDTPDQFINAATSSIFNGGEVPYPDPIGQAKNILRNTGKNAKGSGVRAFGASAKQGVNVFIDSVRGSDSSGGSDQTPPPSSGPPSYIPGG